MSTFTLAISPTLASSDRLLGMVEVILVELGLGGMEPPMIGEKIGFLNR